MGFYSIQSGSPEEREQVKRQLLGLDRLSEDLQEKVVTAWVSSWKSSSYTCLDDMPGFSFSLYRLMDHIHDVVHFGLSLAEESIKRWGMNVDWDDLIQVILLHDIDKPLLLVRDGEVILKSVWGSQIQHGVLGAMLLKELGFTEKVVSTVATHATNSPFHGSSVEAYILHYADLYAADHALMIEGKVPFYQKMSLKK